MSAVEVVPADRGRLRREFLRLPERLYRDDPAWVPPLRLERRQLLDPRRNPFFARAEVALKVALRAGEVCGRVSLHVDRLEERVSGVAASTFGLFEAADEEAARALLADAFAWARARRRARLRGPFSLHVNQESGLLVDGFDSPPMVLMPHGRREYPGWLEKAGLAKAKDLYAWRFRIQGVRPAFRRAAERARATPGLEIRPLDLRRLDLDLPLVRDVFNRAWAGNWGFLPLEEADLEAMARDLRLIADPRTTCIVLVEGEPVAMAIALPNLNEAIADLGGRLLPLGWARLLWRLKVRGLRSGRLALMGAVPGPKGAGKFGLVALILAEMYDRCERAGYRDWEISWTLEDNRAANEGAQTMGGVRAKTYRIYEKLWEAPADGGGAPPPGAT